MTISWFELFSNFEKNSIFPQLPLQLSTACINKAIKELQQMV